MTVKLATSRLPPQTMLNFNENEILLWHKFAGGGGGGGVGGGREIKGWTRNLVKIYFQ